jgi:hypothetical protein
MGHSSRAKGAPAALLETGRGVGRLFLGRGTGSLWSLKTLFSVPMSRHLYVIGSPMSAMSQSWYEARKWFSADRNRHRHGTLILGSASTVEEERGRAAGRRVSKPQIGEPRAKNLLVVIVVIRSWPITAIVTIVAVTPRHIVPIVRRRLVVSTSGRVGALFKHRTASSAKLWSVSLQAGHNPVHIGDLRAAESPNVRRAGYLLFHRSPILLRKCRILYGDAAANRYGKAHENSMRSHAQSFFRTCGTPHDCFCSRFKLNAAWEGSR